MVGEGVRGTWCRLKQRRRLSRSGPPASPVTAKPWPPSADGFAGVGRGAGLGVPPSSSQVKVTGRVEVNSMVGRLLRRRRRDRVDRQLGAPAISSIRAWALTGRRRPLSPRAPTRPARWARPSWIAAGLRRGVRLGAGAATGPRAAPPPRCRRSSAGRFRRDEEGGRPQSVAAMSGLAITSAQRRGRRVPSPVRSSGYGTTRGVGLGVRGAVLEADRADRGHVGGAVVPVDRPARRRRRRPISGTRFRDPGAVLGGANLIRDWRSRSFQVAFRPGKQRSITSGTASSVPRCFSSQTRPDDGFFG